mmetsp:Transcript_38924/g.111832  ORF Transcript_38924/g.111832 Transcript_38924/m.111832 type:complete len:253 (-) Transcript_38924:345-1103(-)
MACRFGVLLLLSQLDSTVSELAQQEAQILEQHNKYRCFHGAAALSWDDQMATLAKIWVSGLGWGSQGYRRLFNANSKQKDFAYTVKTGDSVPGAIVMAYKEGVTDDGMLDAEKGVTSKQLVYAQLVWEGTTSMGCASRALEQEAVLWSCIYNTGPGREVEGYLDEVQPKKDMAYIDLCGLAKKDVEPALVAASRSSVSGPDANDGFFAQRSTRVTTYDKQGSMEGPTDAADHRCSAGVLALVVSAMAALLSK